MTVQIPRHLLTGALAVAVFYGLLGVEIQCQQAEARPSLADLQAQIDALSAEVLHVFDRNGVDVPRFSWTFGTAFQSRRVDLELRSAYHGLQLPSAS